MTDVQRPRVLLVDDNEIVRRTFARTLSRLGFEVTVAAGVTEALERVRAERFDLLVTDLQMAAPTDGFTLISEVAKLQPELARRAVVVTADEFTPHQIEAFAENGYDVRSKADPVPELVAALRALLVRRA
jgi:CheY-like chemotaxis protein